MAGRYAHAKQFKRHECELRFPRTRLGRLVRDIRRKIADDERLGTVFTIPLAQALHVQGQRQRQRGWKLYSLHAPEVECIGKGKAHRPYEFGVKVSITATNGRAPGGQLVVHAHALHGLDASLTQRQAYDGHTLAGVLERVEQLTRVTPRRVCVDKGHRGHDAPPPLRVFLSGQKRGVFGAIKREPAPAGARRTEGRVGVSSRLHDISPDGSGPP